jgi:hypothetical protein
MGKCINCKYWEMNGIAQHNIKKGICRRFPPINGKFPSTYEIDWCGEFKEKVDPFKKMNDK